MKRCSKKLRGQPFERGSRRGVHGVGHQPRVLAGSGVYTVEEAVWIGGGACVVRSGIIGGMASGSWWRRTLSNCVVLGGSWRRGVAEVVRTRYGKGGSPLTLRDKHVTPFVRSIPSIAPASCNIFFLQN